MTENSKEQCREVDLQPWSKHLGTVIKIKSENALLK